MCIRDSISTSKSIYTPKKFTAGFAIGLTQMVYSVKHSPDFTEKYFPYYSYPFKPDSVRIVDINHKYYPGILIGFSGCLSLNKRNDLRLQPSIKFGDLILDYRIETQNPDNLKQATVRLYSQPLFLEFPVYLTHKQQISSKHKMSFTIGPKYSYNIISEHRKKEKTDNGTVLKLYPHELQLGVGVGAQFFKNHFRLGVELLYSHGFKNIFVKSHEIFPTEINEIYSRNISLVFTFD